MTDLFDTREILCGRSSTRAAGAHPKDGGSTPPARSTGPDHPDEDIIPLESYEAEPGDAPGPAFEEPDPATDSYIRLAATLYASGAGQVFIERRLDLQRRHGALAITDLSNPAYALALSLHERASAIVEGLSGRGAPDAATIDAALKRLATAGALALALHDRLQADRAA